MLQSKLRLCSAPVISFTYLFIFTLVNLAIIVSYTGKLGLRNAAVNTDRIDLLTQDPSVNLPTVCSNENCRGEYYRHLQLTSAGQPIPPIRHILWKNESVSKYFAAQLKTWQTIHPDWTFVLWRDQDMEPFVATHFAGMLTKFKSLPQHIMRVDMIRFMLLFKFGGTYADIDYKLVSSLDKFRRFPAVVTREPDFHSLELLGMSWPVQPLVSPAFMMSAPGHVFFHFALHQLMQIKTPLDCNPLHFGGPFGLTTIINSYMDLFPRANNAMETVYVPPSRSFYPYPENRLNSSRSWVVQDRFKTMTKSCNELRSSKEPSKQKLWQNPRLQQFCEDVNNMDPITNKSEPVIAVHDLEKTGPVWGNKNSVDIYFSEQTPLSSVYRNLMLGNKLWLKSRF